MITRELKLPTRGLRPLLVMAFALLIAGCDDRNMNAHVEKSGPHQAAEPDYERGPHNGRLLRSGDFALEITIFEEGVDPQFRVYPYFAGKPADPTQVRLKIELSRLGGRTDRFQFSPQADFLTSPDIVHEPHSFDVTVAADYSGKDFSWAYASYEGRTTIADQAAEAAGVKVEAAGPAPIEEVIELSGRVILQPQGRAEVRAWYPGRIKHMTKTVGETVQQGETLVDVTSGDSLRAYSIPAPMAGTVTERNGNVGELATSQAIYVITDPTKVLAEFFIYPRDAEQVRTGQRVEVRNLTGDKKVNSKITTLLPTAHAATQTLIAHVELPNTDGNWRPGMAIEGAAVVSRQTVPLAVRTRALQRFRDFTVVYARVGETYEVRMLELGKRTPEWTEVLGGLQPGEVYVSDNAFLIRADVEKSGASHDH